MMRKFNKKKGSRRGAILVTVVFILAFAVIFIAAAMMLTQATRKRVYTEAESDQARLTVTSVAEAWYRAIEKCEFADDDILALCDANKTIRVQASDNGNLIPGLEKENTTNANSYTTAHFYRLPLGGGTTDDCYLYRADFTTHIYGHVENVRSELTYTLPTNDSNSGPFSTQIDMYGKFGNNNLELVGDGKPEDALDNIFLVRNGGMNTDNGFSSYATMIYCDGNVSFKAEDFKCTDLVFLTGAKLSGPENSDATKFTGSVKNLFFFGDHNEEIASDNYARNWGGGAGLNFYLCNRSADNSSNWVSNAAKVTKITASGKLASDGTSPVFEDEATQTKFEEKVKAYATYNNNYKKGGAESFPTTDDFIKSAKKLGITKSAPSTATTKDLKSFFRDYCYQKSRTYVPEGTYLFDTDNCDTEEHPSVEYKVSETQTKTYQFSQIKQPNSTDNIGWEPYVMVLDGTKDYKFYFKHDMNFNIWNVIFIVDKPNKNKPVLFILENKTNLYWCGRNNDSASNGQVGSNGILAVSGRNFTSAQKAFDFVIGDDLYGAYYGKPNGPGARGFENTANKGYSFRYNGTNESCAMILGMGNNTFQTDKNAIFESFVGLFNDSYDETGNTVKSHFLFRNSDSGVIYGRIMTDGLGFGGTGQTDSGHIVMPASPGATSIPSNTKKLSKVNTNFKLTRMQYYYAL